MIKKIFWSVLVFILMTNSCDDRIEQTRTAHVVVTMLRVDRIVLDRPWVKSQPIHGTLESEDASVDGMVVHWFSNMYWNQNDSSGYYKLLPNRRNTAVWHDSFGNKDTMNVNVDTLRWVTDKYSIADSNGYFTNTLTPVRAMRGHDLMGDFMMLYWSIENTLIDSQEIFLMD